MNRVKQNTTFERGRIVFRLPWYRKCEKFWNCIHIESCSLILIVVTGWWEAGSQWNASSLHNQSHQRAFRCCVARQDLNNMFRRVEIGRDVLHIFKPAQCDNYSYVGFDVFMMIGFVFASTFRPVFLLIGHLSCSFPAQGVFMWVCLSTTAVTL